MQSELRAWYSKNRHKLKSRQACFDFYLGLASGNALEHVHQIGTLSDMQLSKIGVILENLSGNEEFAKITANDPQVAVQDSLMERIQQLKFSVQKFRLQGLCLYMFAYPWKFVLLAHPDVEARLRAKKL